MGCNRCGFPVPSRTRQSSCSRRRWPRSPLPAPLTGRTCRSTCCRTASCRMRSSRASSTPAKRMPAGSPAPTSLTRPTTMCRRRPRALKGPSASGAVGFWAMALGPARADRSPASSSTIGFAAGAGHCGSPNPTSWSRTPRATGRHSAATAPTSCPCRAFARVRRSRSTKASCSRPTRRCAPQRPAEAKSRAASSRSSTGWDRASMA